MHGVHLNVERHNVPKLTWRPPRSLIVERYHPWYMCTLNSRVKNFRGAFHIPVSHDWPAPLEFWFGTAALCKLHKCLWFKYGWSIHPYPPSRRCLSGYFGFLTPKGHVTHGTESPWPLLHFKHSHWWKRWSRSKFTSSHDAWGTNGVCECEMDGRSTWIPTWHRMDRVSWSLGLF